MNPYLRLLNRFNLAAPGRSNREKNLNRNLQPFRAPYVTIVAFITATLFGPGGSSTRAAPASERLSRLPLGRGPASLQKRLDVLGEGELHVSFRLLEAAGLNRDSRTFAAAIPFILSPGIRYVLCVVDNLILSRKAVLQQMQHILLRASVEVSSGLVYQEHSLPIWAALVFGGESQVKRQEPQKPLASLLNGEGVRRPCPAPR
jgi:hypothetical protein